MSEGPTSHLPCPRCAGTGWDSHDDRRVEMAAAWSHTKCGGRIMACACTTKLNAMAAVTTASTRRLRTVAGLVIGSSLVAAAGDQLRWDSLMAKLSIAKISWIVASAVAPRTTPAAAFGERVSAGERG